jgi:RNA-directed DNA polymerase
LVGRKRLEELRPGERKAHIFHCINSQTDAMRREGHIIEEIVEYSNMAESFDQVLSGTKRKKSHQGRYLLAHREEVIKELSERIASGTFHVTEKDIEEKDIIEAGKLRHIQFFKKLKNSIAVHAIMSVVDKHLKKRFIRTTSASIKNRGMHDLMKYIRRDMQKDPEGTRFCYKFDISKFYESVNQDFVMYSVHRVFKDKKLIAMLDNFVRIIPQGISIGLRSSQGLGNLLLSVYLDHYLKDRYGVRHFYRYCDDGVVLGKSKAELWEIRDAVHEQLEQIDLKVKANERMFPVDEGIDFLGYVIYPDHVLLRKRIKQKFARKMHEVKSKKRRRVLIASFYGMAKHADCIMLFNKLTGKKMKSFKDLNVAYKPEDGKKRFAGAVVSIRELVNLPIVVKDFEVGVKTSQGEDRCVVSIEQNGEPKKFFTNSEEMKNILQQVSEMPDGFPFETTIKAETFGKGRTKYIFT